MATYQGTGGLIKAITATGTPATVAEVKNWSAEFTCDAIEDSAIGDTQRTRVAGLKSGTISLEAHYDSSDGAQADLVAGALVNFTLHPMGGAAKYTGSAIVTRARVNNEGVSGIVGLSVDLQVTGAVT